MGRCDATRLLALVFLASACGGRKAKPGTLRDVASPRITFVDVNAQPASPANWHVLVANTDAQGTCRRLPGDLTVTVNGVAAQVVELGEMRAPGKAAFAEPSCAPLDAIVPLPARSSDTESVTVRDGTLELQASFPAFLRAATIESPPKLAARPGERVTLTLSRALHGDPSVTLLRDAGSMPVTHTRDGKSMTLGVPRDAPVGVGRLIVVELAPVAPRSCDAAGGCAAEVKHTYELPLEVLGP